MLCFRNSDHGHPIRGHSKLLSRIQNADAFGYRLHRVHSHRAGRRKQRKISVVIGTTSLNQKSKTVRPNAISITNMPPSLADVTLTDPPNGCNPSNLIVLRLQKSDCQLCLCVFNAQSVGPRAKRSAICDFVRDHDVDVCLITETWLRRCGDEAKCRDLTPPSQATRYTRFLVQTPPPPGDRLAVASLS